MKSPYYGTYQFHPSGVYKTVQEAGHAKTFDYVLVSTKSLPDFENMAETIMPYVFISVRGRLHDNTANAYIVKPG